MHNKVLVLEIAESKLCLVIIPNFFGGRYVAFQQHL
jgi:hypothetical protein